MMTSLSIRSNPLAPAVDRKPRFGLAGVLTPGVDKVMNFLEGDRTRQMLVEDFVGFGVLRTVIDLFRGYFFGDEKQKTNVPMAVERLLREVGSILTDNVSSGVAAFLLGKWLLDKKYKAYSNNFTSYPALEFFQSHLQHSRDEKVFLTQIANTLGGAGKSQAILAQLEKVWNSGAAIPTKQQGKVAVSKWNDTLNDCAVNIAKVLGKEDFDFTDANQHTFALNELMADLAEFRGALQKRLPTVANWQHEAQDLLKKTIKAKNIKLSTCLWVGLGLTFAMPYAIRKFTHKVYHLTMYPGELGLAEKKRSPVPVFSGNSAVLGNALPGSLYAAPAVPFAVPANPFPNSSFSLSPASLSPTGQPLTPQIAPTPTALQGRPQSSAPHEPDWLEHFFPYLTRSARRGNFWPLLVSVLPLPFAAGLFDTVHRKVILPFTKQGFKQWRNLLDFGKRFPYTTQQQIAALFAFLIFSRLTSARSENEFRERTVDSFLGWGFWILATPWIQKQAARLLSGIKKDSQLLKANGGLLTRLEIEKFLTGAVQKTTRNHHIWLGALSTVITMGLIGLLEPWLAIQWTKRNGASSI